MCNIQVVTIYSFSIENFQRPKSQVDALMEIFKHYLLSISKRGGLLERYGAKMRVLGRLELLEPDLMSTIRRTTDLTRDYGDKTLNVCLSYTSRDEIAGSIRQTVADCKIPEQADSYDDKIGSDLVRDTSSRWPCHISSKSSLHDGQYEKPVNVGTSMAISPEDISAETLTNRMLTTGDPPVDLLIRTSGASRLSDYLLWQCHQETQIMFRNAMWPDFGLWQFYSAIREWQQQKQKSVIKSEKVRKTLQIE
jgi:ditrans,polycis-polyprenyl diphosphate synthase